VPTKKYKLKNGKRVPGVTTIIGASLGWGKEALMYWAWKQGLDGKDFREERDKAADAGTIAHVLASADIKGELLPGPAETDDEATWASARTAFEAYLEWKEMTKLSLIGSELSYISENHKFGGTIDAIARFGKRVELIDFKHTNGTHPDHVIQVAAYKHLCEEGIPFDHDGPSSLHISGIHLLRFSKRGDFHHSYYSAGRMIVPWITFLDLRALYEYKKEIEGML
jgi:hypothetical protein